jgi:16S rRNA (uracil1498-N3)-methyltransferase
VSGPHFFVESLSGEQVELSADDSRHALRSLRTRQGDRLSLADGKGMVAWGRLAGERDGHAVVAIEEARRAAPRRPLVTLAIAPPTGDRLGWAVQKLAELGADELALLRTERSVRRLAPDRASRAMARLRVIAREAAMQSRQPWVMDVCGPVDLGAAVDDTPTFLLWEGTAPGLVPLLPEGPSRVRLIVGPEGGFTHTEVEAARRGGATVASLGPSILRTETAAMVGATLVLARYGRLG